MAYANSISFGSYHVALEVDDTSCVSFWVNNSFSVDSENPHKVAITKWLLKEFKNICRHYTYLWCSAYDDDPHYYNRVVIYTKMGFIPLRGNLFFFPNFSSKEEEENFVANLVQEYPELVFDEDLFYEGVGWYVDINIPKYGFYKAELLPCKEETLNITRRRQKQRID